jgi:hypothetical protein
LIMAIMWRSSLWGGWKSYTSEHETMTFCMLIDPQSVNTL